MTECPAFLFIFLPRSISEQRGPGRSPSPALRAPDLSRPPYRSEHLQNRRAIAAPGIIKATIHLPAERGRGNKPALGRWGWGQRANRPDRLQRVSRNHTPPRQPLWARWARRRERERMTRALLKQEAQRGSWPGGRRLGLVPDPRRGGGAGNRRTLPHPPL